MIDVGTAACSSAHAKPLPTVATATGRKRKCVDPGVIMTKCLTTVAKHSGLWVRVICMNTENIPNIMNIGLLLPCIIWIQGMHKWCHVVMIADFFSMMVMFLRNHAEFKSVNLLFHMLGINYSYRFLLSWGMACLTV